MKSHYPLRTAHVTKKYCYNGIAQVPYAWMDLEKLQSLISMKM